MESTEEKLLDVQQSVLQELIQACPSCDSQISLITDGEFSCPTGPDSNDVLYRARLHGTRADVCGELVSALTNWIQSSQRTTLTIQDSPLQVVQNCVVEIETFQSDLNCPLSLTTEVGGVAPPGASVASGTLTGVVVGVVGAVLVLIVVPVIIAVAVILKKRKRKGFVHLTYKINSYT